MGMDRIGISNLFFPRQGAQTAPRRNIARSKKRSTKPFDLATITTPRDTHPLARAFRRIPHSLKRVFKKIRRKKQDKFAQFRDQAPYFQEIFEAEEATFKPKRNHTLSPPISSALSSSNTELFFERKEDVFKQIDLHSGPRPLLCRGRLLHDRSGLVYLKVDPRFVKLHTPLIDDPSALPPQTSILGAHIPIITPDESKRNNLWGAMPELGKNFYFSILGTYEVTHTSDPKLEKSYLFHIESDTLDQVRKNHTLTPRPFYLTFGIKKRTRTQPIAEAGYFRVHPGISSV